MGIALGIMCKAPRPGRTKTRLASLVGANDAATLSACFLQDVARTIDELAAVPAVSGYGVYMPAGGEDELRALLPRSFDLLLQEGEDFGFVLRSAAQALLARHEAVVLINSDSPTLPASLLMSAVAELAKQGDRVVLAPAIDGGYTFIGLKADHAELFSKIPWSTSEVFRLTCERAQSISLPTVILPVWYDIDDAASLAILQDELAGRPPSFAAPELIGAAAPATRGFLARRGAHA